MPEIRIHIIPLPQPTGTVGIGLPIASTGTIITIASNLTEDSEIRALIGKELHISSKFFAFSPGRGPPDRLHPNHTKKRKRRDFHMRRCTPWQECASLAKRTTKHRRIYEKTSFTSIGSNRTGSGSGKTS